MQRLFSSQPVPEPLRGAVVALGNFDGFHLGHQAVAGRARDLAQSLGAPLIIATFDPHPVNYFQPAARPFRLTNLAQRQRLFAETGAAAMLLFEFGPELATTSAESFIDDLLVDRFGVAGIVTGSDFGFGRERRGNVGMLRAAAEAGKFAIATVDPVYDDGQVVSSTLIRDALRDGDCNLASRLLSRPFAIEGEVEHGDKVGRTLGYPTANIGLGTYLRPRYGVYAVTGRLEDGRVVKGAANLGIRPQFDPPQELLEPHFFDFSEDLYGQDVEVAFHAFLRDEASFSSLDQLQQQMARDCDRARTLLDRLFPA